MVPYHRFCPELLVPEKRGATVSTKEPENQMTGERQGQSGGAGDQPQMITLNQESMIKPSSFLAVWIDIESGREARPRGPQGGLRMWFSGSLVEPEGIGLPRRTLTCSFGSLVLWFPRRSGSHLTSHLVLWFFGSSCSTPCFQAPKAPDKI